MSIRTILIVGLALIFGVSAALGVNMLVNQTTPRVDTIPIVVAATDISRGGTIAADQIKLVNCPKELVPAGVITKLEDALDRVVFQPVVKDEPVLERQLGAKHGRAGLAGLIPTGMRAFTIQTPSVAAGVAGFVLPGNRVDVLLTMSGNDQTGGGITTTLLQNIEILAVDQRLDAPSEHKVDPRNLQSVTLLVTPDQAAKLDLGQNRGTLHLSLRNPEDSRQANARPATLSGLQFYQEKPWSEQAKDVLAALRNWGGPSSPKEASPATAATAADSPKPTLEIRTLRGTVHGIIPIEPAGRAAGKR